MKIDYSSVNPANSTLVGSLSMAAMTADHGNPLVNAAVGAGVGAAVGVGARIKQAVDKKKQANRHSATSDTQFGKVK